MCLEGFEILCENYGTDISAISYPIAISHETHPLILLRAKGTRCKRLLLADCFQCELYHLGEGSWEDQLNVLKSNEWAAEKYGITSDSETLGYYFPRYSCH